MINTKCIDSDLHQSEVISAIRFPLIVMIVLFHLYPPGQTIKTPYSLYNVIATFLSAHGIARLAVPAFFLISGYFFFYHLRKLDKAMYASKLRKRVSTLLVPYLLWNGIPIVGIIIARLLIGMKTGDSLNSVKEFCGSIGWLRALWDCGIPNGHPFDVPLWYVRDLMVCCICSPVIFFLVRRYKLFYILVLGILFLTDTWLDVAGFDSRAWFFFSLGAYLSINNVNMVGLLRKYAIAIIPLSIILLVCTTYFNEFMGRGIIVLDNAFLLTGVGAMIASFEFLLRKGIICNNPFLTRSVFFIYAFHVFPLPGIVSVTAFCKNLTEKLIVEGQGITYYIQLAICPLAIIGVCLAVYYIMHCYTPKLLSVLTGQR